MEGSLDDARDDRENYVKNLSEPNEDYLERIAELIGEKGYARVSDMAEKLSIKPASVTKMIQKLEELGYVNREPYRGFVLTTKGKTVGAKIAHRHKVLTAFLKQLGISKRTIEKDVEGMEHHLSDETVRALEKLLD